MDLLEIGQLVKTQRLKRGVNQAKLAENAGVSRATLSALENGQLPEIGVNRLLRLLDALALSMAFPPALSERPTMDELQDRRARDDAARPQSRYRG